MGQFVILPDGTLLVVNGALNGTAGYADHTGETKTYGEMPYGMSLASGPVLTPALYNPRAPAGKRWSRDGFTSSMIPRLYHSSAVLMPDASVLIAGSNPNVDYNGTTIYSTEYRAENFYPSYFSAKVRPSASGIPKRLSYGGPPFDLVIDPSSYTGNANEAAGNTTVVLMRTGFTTHAMNMGQRMLQLNNTFTVQGDGTIILHVSQVPPNPNLLTPGPVFLHVVIRGIPSVGTYVIVGSGKIELQEVKPVPALPASQLSSNSQAAGNGKTGSSDGGGVSRGLIIGVVVGGIAILALIGATWAIVIAKRKKTARRFVAPDVSFSPALVPPRKGYGGDGRQVHGSSSFIPLNPYYKDASNSSVHGAWSPPQQPSPGMGSTASFPHDGQPGYSDYDPYREHPPSSPPRRVNGYQPYQPYHDSGRAM